MPLIPGVNEREIAPAPANTPYETVQATSEAFDGEIGKSMLAVSKGFAAGAEAAGKFKAVQDAADQEASAKADNHAREAASAAIAASNRFYGQAQDLQAGYLNLAGGDAVADLPRALRSVEALQQGALSATPSPTTAQLAEPAIVAWGNLLKGGMERHAAAQQGVYDDDLDDTQVTLNRDAVARLYNDDAAFFANLHTAVATRQDQALRHLQASGVKPSPADGQAVSLAVSRFTVSDFVRTRIEAALVQNDVAAAQVLHARWGGDLLPTDQAVVTHHMAAATFTQRLKAATEQALTSR